MKAINVLATEELKKRTNKQTPKRRRTKNTNLTQRK